MKSILASWGEDLMKRLLKVLALVAFMPFGGAARADDNEAIYTANSLRVMTQTNLTSVYLQKPAGPIPDGDSNGTAVFFAGSILAQPVTMLANYIWQGKVFDTDTGILTNKVFGFRAIKAKVFYGPSLLDGKQAVIIDYHDTSILAHKIRDEIRLVSPNLYLGRAYWRGYLGDYMIVNFILDFNK